LDIVYCNSVNKR